jgi:hypothetical protein
MGQIVDRRPVRDLTYNTRFGWLILRRQSKNPARLKPRPRPPWRRPHRWNVRSANRRRKGSGNRKGNVVKDKAPKGHAAKAEGRANDAIAGVRTAAVKEVAAIEVTTGVAAIAAASKARRKSTSRN